MLEGKAVASTVDTLEMLLYSSLVFQANTAWPQVNSDLSFHLLQRTDFTDFTFYKICLHAQVSPPPVPAKFLLRAAPPQSSKGPPELHPANAAAKETLHHPPVPPLPDAKPAAKAELKLS